MSPGDEEIDRAHEDVGPDAKAEPVPRREKRYDPDEDRNFTIAQLLAIMTIAAVELSIVRWFSPPVAAFVSGLLLFAFWSSYGFLELSGLVWRLTGWMLAIVYATAIVIAYNGQ